MPSRRSVLALAVTGLAGCADVSPLSVPRIASQSCPPFDVDGRAVCSHTDEPGGLDVTVSNPVVSTDREALERSTFRIDNGTDDVVETNPEHWRLHRNAGLGWSRREFSPAMTDVVRLEPGHSASWSGLDALFKLGATGSTPRGLYAAVLPARAGEEPVNLFVLFRVAADR